ncbi:MAG: hypothetical protein QM581_08460 [Pseudomonas sp.]
MSTQRKSPLLTWTHGDGDTPLLLLHERYQDPATMPAPPVPAGMRVIRVRSPRQQMAGISTLGYFWFLGPLQAPEPSTFGDGLHHLESLLLELSFGPGKPASVLVGSGEGGVMALVLATLWPELLAGVVSIDGPLPHNLAGFPIEPRVPLQLPVLLIEHDRELADSAQALSALGARVQRHAAEAAPIRQALDWAARHAAALVPGTANGRARTQATAAPRA